MHGSALRSEFAGGLALVGGRASGKTTVGRLVAAAMDRPFFDLDAVIEARLGRTIARVFAEQGEPAFRGAERATLAALLAEQPGAVVATGGGAVLDPANRLAMRRFGLVVWLDAPADVLAARLAADPADRPPLTARGLVDEVAEILDRRRALYRETCHVVVRTDDRTPEQAAAEIADAWRRHVAAGSRIGEAPP
jgi:shikimate kinase